VLHKNSQHITRATVSGAKAAASLLFATIGAWIAYSTFAVEHDVPLPPAVDAERKVLTPAGVGRLSYYVDKMNAGRPLLLVHSINAAPSAFELKPLFDHYRRHRPVYAVDLPGFGFSERSNRRYSPALYQEAIQQMLVTIGEPADVIALSLSCEFAATVALTHPEMVNSLVCLSPTGLNANPVRISATTSKRIYDAVTVPLWGQALYDLLVIRPSIRYFLNMSLVESAPDEMIDYAYATSHQPGAKIAPFHFLSGQLFTWDILPTVYEKLTTPTLMIYDQDPNIDFGMLPQLLQRNPAVRGARIAPTLGLAHWEKLAETTAVLDEFWNDKDE
jgi:pimeloyl-ACP methyl ester carboxylesterase